MKQPENKPELKKMARTMIAFISSLNYTPSEILLRAHVNYSNFMNGQISLSDETKLNLFRLLKCTRHDYYRFEIANEK